MKQKIGVLRVFPCQVVFICNHCPYVIHLREALIKISKEYIDKEGLGVVAISSNSIVTHPQVRQYLSVTVWQ